MIHLTFIFCLCVTAINAVSRPSRGHARIVEGVDTAITEAPHQVAILYKNGLHCSGTIFTDNVIITAAHCVGVNKNGMTVRAGSTYYDEGGSVHKVKKVVPHPNHNRKTGENDIAIIQLETPVKRSHAVRAISLAVREPKVGDKVFVSGWGATEHGGKPSKQLQSIYSTVVSRDFCKEKLKRITGTINENVWCAGGNDNGQDTCKGDSGAAAVKDKKLVGIVSWGHGCGRAGYPYVFTNIAKYRMWIATEAQRAKTS